MRIRRWLGVCLATLMASTGTLLFAPAASAQTAYLELVWIRCQDTTGEPFSDEILVYAGNGPTLASFFENFDATDLLHFRDHAPARTVHEFTGSTTYIDVWERDNYSSPWVPNSDADHVGLIAVPRSQINTGYHEGYAFLDGEYIIQYRVTSTRP